MFYGEYHRRTFDTQQSKHRPSRRRKRKPDAPAFDRSRGYRDGHSVFGDGREAYMLQPEFEIVSVREENEVECRRRTKGCCVRAMNRPGGGGPGRRTPGLPPVRAK